VIREYLDRSWYVYPESTIDQENFRFPRREAGRGLGSMVERLPEVEVHLPSHEGGAARVIWNGEPVEPDEIKVDDEGKIEIVVAGVTYDEHNAVIRVRRG
jgi:hypothetical protein